MIYTGFDPDKFQEKRTAIIDGDGFAYVISWLGREALFPKEITDMVDGCMHDILQGTQSEHYIGVLSPSLFTGEVIEHKDGEIEQILSRPNFRKAIAKSKPYKGNRPEKPEHYTKWAGLIEGHLEEAWGFIRTPEGYEADDLCHTLTYELTSAGAIVVLCENDKDYNQTEGQHFNVKKKSFKTIDKFQASYALWFQVLIGDSTDNIQGLEKCGEVGASNILGTTQVGYQEHRTKVMEAFIEKFGEDIGIQKLYENYMLVKLRTDVPTEQFDLQEVCRGYDLAKYEVQFHEENHRPDEPEEPIPDFSITD
jgi:5'-3' exonuclease